MCLKLWTHFLYPPVHAPPHGSFWTHFLYILLSTSSWELWTHFLYILLSTSSWELWTHFLYPPVHLLMGALDTLPISSCPPPHDKKCVKSSHAWELLTHFLSTSSWELWTHFLLYPPVHLLVGALDTLPIISSCPPPRGSFGHTSYYILLSTSSWELWTHFLLYPPVHLLMGMTTLNQQTLPHPLSSH